MLRTVKYRKRDAGSALVEFALSTVTILTLLFGTIDLGRAAYAYNWVANAARLGTRFAMVRGMNCTGLSGGCPATGDDVRAYIASDATGIDTSTTQLTVTSGCYATGTPIPTPLPCAPQSSVKVTVQYNFKFLSPLLMKSWTMQSLSERVVQN